MKIVQYKPTESQNETGKHWDGAKGGHCFALVKKDKAFTLVDPDGMYVEPEWSNVGFRFSHLHDFRLELIY